MNSILNAFAAFAMLVGGAFFGATDARAETEVLWLGQASTRITTDGGKVIMIDPFLVNNPKTPAEWKDLAKLGSVDVILVTHGHFDHVADVGALAKMTGAKVVGSGALTRQLVAFGVIEKEQAISMNKGGTIAPVGDDVQISMVPADHSSALTLPRPDTGVSETVYAGASVGYVIKIDGLSIYHTGDTNVFTDMALIRELHQPNLVLASIGGHFTMDPDGAAHAMREFIKTKQVIPIHYGTFPLLKGNTADFEAALEGTEIEVLTIEPGQSLKF